MERAAAAAAAMATATGAGAGTGAAGGNGDPSARTVLWRADVRTLMETRIGFGPDSLWASSGGVVIPHEVDKMAVRCYMLYVRNVANYDGAPRIYNAWIAISIPHGASGWRYGASIRTEDLLPHVMETGDLKRMEVYLSWPNCGRPCATATGAN